MKSLKWFAVVLPGFGATIVLAGCGSSGVMQPVLVTMGTTPSSVQSGGTAQISATVSNDGSNRGVNWTVTCPLGGAACGSVSPTNTTSGVATTYTAPTTPPAGDLTVTITATAAADGTTAVSASFKVPGITVNVPAPSKTMLQVNETAQITATVTGDTANKGVTWTVSCNVVDCGKVAPSPTLSGAPTTYTAPSAPPAGNLVVTITAASVTNSAATGSTTVTIMGITVTVAPTTATLQAGATAQFTATVTGDPANAGVTWTVSCNVVDCGKAAPSPTLSGAPTTYTAPAIAPARNLSVTLTASSVTNNAASAPATITVLGITISIAPTSANVQSAGTQPFTATVGNDPSNSGVTWSLQYSTTVCQPIFHCTTTFHPCSSQCGSVSPTSAASGIATTYTAPNTAPHFLGLLPRGPYVVATSVANTGAFSRAQITVLAISVSISSTPASIAVNATQTITATVTNDGANGGTGAGVAWMLKQNGVVCSPGCGTISPTSTASGAAATYTAPATVPAYPLLTITATAVTDTTKSASVTITVTTASGAGCGAGSGSESLLKGQYTLRLQGFLPGGFEASVGSFTADGTGKITGGELDAANTGAQSIDTTKSSYWVGPDHRGCLTLGGTTYYRFALGTINSGVATAGHIIEFDDTTGTGLRVAGTLKLQDATSFAASKFKGNYVIGLVGGNVSGSRSAVAGTFASDGISLITVSNLDFDSAGAITSNIASAPGGSFTCCDANGRGTLQLTGGNFTISLVLYMVNSSDIFFESTDGIFSGEGIGVPTGTTFTQASLTSAAVIRKTAQLSAGPIVDIALASSNGTGGINITDNTNNAGTFSSGTTPFTYTVASNGRVTLIGGTKPPVFYLFGQNAGFLVGTDANVEFGIIEPQAAGPFSAASLSGGYTLGTENPSSMTVALESGVATPDGAGNVAGTSDQSSSAGLAQNQNLALSYSVLPNGTGTFGTGTTAILISGSKLVFINNSSATPTITIVEK